MQNAASGGQTASACGGWKASARRRAAASRGGRSGCNRFRGQRGAQCLKGVGQVLVRRKGHALAVVEKLPDIPCRFRRRNDQLRVVRAVGQARPAVRPLDFCRAVSRPACSFRAPSGAGADVGDVPLAADLDKAGVTAFLQRVGSIVPRGQQREIGRILPRAVQRFGARDCGGVQVARAARRAEQVIPAVLLRICGPSQTPNDVPR